MWQPISISELFDNIFFGESKLIGRTWNFWNLIKIVPEKWEEDSYGKEGGGFWVVAICGERVIWYNDIEEGFNVSKYNQYGKIAGYWCNQSSLDEVLVMMLGLIDFGSNALPQASPPVNLF